MEQHGTNINKSTPEPQPKRIQAEPIVEPEVEPVAESVPPPVALPVEKKLESSPTPQNISTAPSTMVVTGNKAKIRKKPSTKADIVKSMKKGEVVQMIKQSDDWFQIELASGDVGWCHKSVLELRN